MTTKITVIIKESTARKAKSYAAKNKISLSKLIDELLTKHISKRKKAGKTFVEKYAGTLSGGIPDIDAARDKYLKEKYLL